MDLFGNILSIFSAPFKSPSTLWLIVPLVLFWIVLEIYFGKHKREELGWNTALANGLTIFWICLDVLKNIGFTYPRTLVIIGFMLYGALILLISFKHLFGSKLTFLLASPTVTYYTCFIAVLWGYGLIDLNFEMAVSIVLLFFLIIGVTKVLQRAVHESEAVSESVSAQKKP